MGLYKLNYLIENVKTNYWGGGNIQFVNKNYKNILFKAQILNKMVG